MADWPSKKNAAFNVHFPIYDNDGDLVTAAAGLDSEVSIDHGTFTDCTNEATEIATSSGVYYLALTQAEMNGDIITTITKTTTTNAKTAVNVMYTAANQLADIKTDTAAVKVQTDKMAFTVANQIDSNVIDWKGGAAPAMTGDAYARLGAPAGASVSADVAAVKVDTAAVKVVTDKLAFTVANQVDANVIDWKGAAAPAMTGDAFARLGAPVGASISADIAATKALLPAALVGGRMDASVGAMANDVVTAAALAADAATEIADAILKRDIDQVEATAAIDSLCTAILKAVSRVKDNAGTLEVYRTNGTTLHMSQTITTDAALDAISELAEGV